MVRTLRGRPFVAVVRVRDEILALPKGHPTGRVRPGGRRARCARRPASRPSRSRSSATSATGTRATATACSRSSASSSSLPLRQRRGPRRRGRGGALDTARGGARAARLQGRAGDGRGRAVATGERQLGCRAVFVLNFYSPVFVDQLKRGRKTATIRLGRQEQEVPQGRGRDDHGRLPALAAREDLRGGDRQRRGQAGAATSRRATSSTTTRSSAGSTRWSTSWSRSTAARSSMDDTVTVVRFSQISDRPSEIRGAAAARTRPPRTSADSRPHSGLRVGTLGARVPAWHSRC